MTKSVSPGTGPSQSFGSDVSLRENTEHRSIFSEWLYKTRWPDLKSFCSKFSVFKLQDLKTDNFRNNNEYLYKTVCYNQLDLFCSGVSVSHCSKALNKTSSSLFRSFVFLPSLLLTPLYQERNHQPKVCVLRLQRGQVYKPMIVYKSVHGLLWRSLFLLHSFQFCWIW